MKIVWARENDKISFNRPNVFFVTGIKGSGKSSLLEHIAEQYLAHDEAVRRRGACMACKRAKSKYFNEKARKS